MESSINIDYATCSNVPFKVGISLLTFFWDTLSITVNAVLRSATIIVFLLVSLFRSVINHFIYFAAPRCRAYVLMCYVF